MCEIKDEELKKSKSFVEQFVEEDLSEGKNDSRIQTRFPPEPNGYIHIGHAKAICMDFGVAANYGGVCNLRFDDTNPSKEDTEYVDSIMNDIKWLGFEWGNVYYASDYFQYLWDFAVWLIKQGKAYIDEQTSEEIAAQKGTPTSPGVASPYRDRPVEENLELFYKMNTPDVPEGSMVLRAKLDMANPNMHFRDPIIYRIIHTPHHRTGTKWNAYPMYDFAHGQSDYFEGVTHSICTLEFVPHRPLYDHFVDELIEYEKSLPESERRPIGVDINNYRTRQIEFNRLNLTYTVMSKRKLKALVDEHLVDGWDDPRMPTVCGMRRRGYTPGAIREFCDRVGVSKVESESDPALLEWCVREELNQTATRRMAVLDPVKVVIDNWEGPAKDVELPNNPLNEAAGTRKLPFGKEIWIERADFQEVPEKKFFRMAPGQEVRLRGACIFKCTGCVKDANGVVTEIHGTWDPESWGGNAADGRKVKGTIHWVDCATGVKAEVRLYDRLFTEKDPLKDGPSEFLKYMNKDSLKTITAYVEPALGEAKPLDHFQFERTGYFVADEYDSKPGAPVFNRTVTLKDSYKPA